MTLGVNGRFLTAPATGVQRVAREVLRRLPGKADVTLFLPREAPEPRDLPPCRTDRGILGGRLWEQVELPARARRAGVSVVLHLANAAPLVGGPHVVVLHDLIPLDRPGDFRSAYRAWVAVAHVQAARRAAAVVTGSDWSADRIARHCGIRREDVHVVRQGAGPLDAPAAAAAVAEVRSRFGLGERYLLAVLGSDPRKGADFLKRVWAALPAAPTLALVGRDAGSVHRRREESADVAGVRDLGPVSDDDLRALYTGAIALLHPSEAEGFGRPPLEALACGTRAIVAPYGPAREVLGTAADLVELEPAAWLDAVRAVLVEPEAVRSTRIAAGRAWARRFDWDHTVDEILAVCTAIARAPA